jgi:hypothetical protein
MSVPARRRRAAAWIAVVAAVTLAHALVTREVAESRLAWRTSREAMPARIEVAFVRELAPVAPVVVPAAPPPMRKRPRRAVRPVLPASAPAPAAESSAPADAVVAAASSPVMEPPAEPPAAAEPLPAEASAPAGTPPASAPAVADAAASAPAPFEWPPSTRISYVLRGYYRGDLEGRAQVEWVRAGGRYQVHLDVSAALLFSRRMTSDGELSDEGLRPQRYDEETRVGWLEPRRVSMRFEPGQVVLANGMRTTAPANVQDTASQFVHLTWMFITRPQQLRVGEVIELPLALPRRVKRIVFDVVGEERLDTPVGSLDTFHLVPRTDLRRGNELTAQVWVAPSLQYLPVRIRIHQDDESWVDLALRSLPLQAAPEGVAPAVSPPAAR